WKRCEAHSKRACSSVRWGGCDAFESVANFLHRTDRQVGVIFEDKARLDREGGQRSEIRTRTVLAFSVAKAVASQPVCRRHKDANPKVALVHVGCPMLRRFSAFIGPSRF